jgi:GT2 family glycosyltransferase
VIYSIACAACEGPGPQLPTSDEYVHLFDNSKNEFTPCEVYQELLEDLTGADVIIYLHDDVAIYDPKWVITLLDVFTQHPNCIAVGFGGATGLGSWNLHRQPYALRNMARSRYASNQTDAEVHGERFTGERRVAVLDAFCMAVRRDYLLDVGGWPINHITHHCLDLWLACQAARDGREIWMTGVECNHYGGGSSTKGVYHGAKWL